MAPSSLSDIVEILKNFISCWKYKLKN